MVKNNSYVIMGSKHCGKSTHGKAIAEKLGIKFFDVDEVIERLTGMSVRDFYNKEGAAAFMQTEEFACKRIIDYTNEQNSDVVISTGGGICDNPPALAQLRVCKSFVFLKLEIKDMVNRILDEMKEDSENNEEDNEEEEKVDLSKLPAFVANANPKPKTMTAVKNLLTERFTSRNETYEKIADIIVDIKNAPIEENTDIIYKALF